ncbi:aspartyl-tRNA synthetase [Histoplasma capsulatum G186AR]|uniref:Aspartate--tRNA ligase, cytoplasmic n=2 Tax=Ajellomyces capsulatus TaxID=5037 RepID=C0NBX5_AJECG|nr:aspartyl-tRNA synthetase [Histoplasma capsulatum G186AR]EEH11166.1 aspartyl-tRNA synthetase [Histoplasma capsulatum G186AR]KAG5302988.1 aspartyl-tRNA synthetase [Histoplasma capsulatum]QSS71612.1 aspartyl-tRNA synthetase [Histoplasma capsulatum G186AR]
MTGSSQAVPIVEQGAGKQNERHQRSLSLNVAIKTALTRLKDTTRPNSDNESPSSPRKSLASFFLDRDVVSSSDDLPSDDSDFMSKKQQNRHERKLKRESRARISGEISERSESLKRERDAQAAREETDEMKARYGDLPLMQSKQRPRQNLIKFDNITPHSIGQEVTFRARVHHIRNMSSKLVFVIFRQQVTTMQGVLAEKPGVISTLMVQWVERIRVGSIVKVRGVLSSSKVPVTGCTIHDVELDIQELHVVVHREDPIPFSVYEAELLNKDAKNTDGRRNHVLDRTRLSNRILDLRTDTSQSIFRIQSAISNLFRAALDAQGFIEIHTPKLQSSATESGASVFEVKYFTREAFLAQSPQLAKQMAIAADFERVYEIGAVFRAENSNTHRHLTEYTGLDIEMAIEEHYHEALETIDSVLKEIFKGIYGRYRREVDIIKGQFPHEDLIWLDETPIIPFAEGIKLLNDSGWRQDGEELSVNEDLGTRDEIRLGELIKEKYHTDYYILDKFPKSARPFYAMEDPENPNFTNSFDIFVRGQEIVSGGQRIHDEKILEQRMKEAGINPLAMEEYLEGFRWGAPPHAGAGIGLERLLMLILKLGNIRLASLFHRDPKSFQDMPDTSRILPYPESSTLEPPWEKKGNQKHTGIDKNRKFQPLDELIANYGDATSTSWPDEKYKIWRDYTSGAAIAYVPSTHGFAIIPGNPLCDPSQYAKVSIRFLRWLKAETHLKPIWILCSRPVEEILGEKLGWRTLSCVGEARIDPSRNQAAADADISKKIRQAEREGVKVHHIPSDRPLPEDITSKIDARIKEWRENRKGPQIYLSGIKPWRSPRNYQYYYAADKNGTVCSFVALARLGANHMQIKYSLDFPGAPSGSIEYLITHAIQATGRSGVKSLTFGAGAASNLIPGHNMSSAKGKVLQTTYDTLVKQFGLNRKTEFRAKLGAFEEPLFIAYPRHGMGSKGIRAILNFFED